MDRIDVRLDTELKERIESAAKAEGVSPSEVVGAVLREHFNTNQPPASCLDIALKLGLVGIYTDAPSDLSTNKAHLEGLGVGCPT
jgi:hypothetical protein